VGFVELDGRYSFPSILFPTGFLLSSYVKMAIVHYYLIVIVTALCYSTGAGEKKLGYIQPKATPYNFAE